ncbi:MAG: rhomboid family intramembrane serine protease [Firmicutes bacterium]|nr:rhomboid family intramembrane serine protease [Bacillota bacterium]
MNTDALRVLISRLSALGYQIKKTPFKEGFILLAKEEPFHRKLLLIGANLYQAEEWRSFIIQTVLAERDGRMPLALALIVFGVGEGQKELLDYLGEMPWVEAIWEVVDGELFGVKTHFRWQVEEKILLLATRTSPSFSGEEKPAAAERRRGQWAQVFTWILLGINLAVFLVEMMSGGSNKTSVLIKLGAKYNPRLWMGEYWRFLTPLFLHAGWEHFLFNSLALFKLGGIVEKIFGPSRFLAIYFAAGLGGTVASVLFRPDTVAVGASGAIFGLLGALIYFSIRCPQTAKGLFGRSLWVTLGLNLVLSFVIPGIDYMGHLGGLVVGLLCAYAVGLGKKDQLPGRWLWRLLLLVIMTTTVVKAATPPPTKWHLPLEEGRIALEKGELDKAIAPLEESYQLNPASRLTHRMLTGVYVELGAQALNAKEWDAAVYYLEQSRRLDSGGQQGKNLLVRAYLYRGYHRYNAGELEGAEEDCLRGIALNNKVEGFHYILGVVYYRQQRVEEAVHELETVLRLNPGNLEAQALLAELKTGDERRP